MESIRCQVASWRHQVSWTVSDGVDTGCAAGHGVAAAWLSPSCILTPQTPPSPTAHPTP